ncbi:MAG: thioredoxin family protein [Bacteroidia bacterium]|nr:thioredoxin family protein [Bacteroidia bacterium]
MAVNISDDSKFQNDIQHPKVVVKYYADWCGSCKLFAPKFRRLSDDERFKDIVFLDVNAEHNPEARKLAQVTTLPYFGLFENGQFKEGMSTSKEDMFVEFLSK